MSGLTPSNWEEFKGIVSELKQKDTQYISLHGRQDKILQDMRYLITVMLIVLCFSSFVCDKKSSFEIR